MADIVTRLRDDAEYHRQVAGEWDGQPEDTINWEHATNCENAASEIERLRAQVEGMRANTIEECARAAEAQDRTGYEWVRDSLWAKILRRAGENVRKLKSPAVTSTQHQEPGALSEATPQERA